MPRPTLARGLLSILSQLRSRLLAAPVLVLAVYLPFALLHSAATTDTMTLRAPHVQQRDIGDAERALARIPSESFTTASELDRLARDESVSESERLIYRHAPLLLDRGQHFPAADDTILGLYYTTSESTSGEATAMTIRYYLTFTDENGGMPIDERMARFGHPFDRELVYRLTLLNGEVAGAWYQAPGHRQVRFDLEAGTRPVFAIASANHNFRRVGRAELERRDARLLAPLPREYSSRIYRDPDFVALAAREIWRQYGIDLSQYVYVTFSGSGWVGEVIISARVADRWYYLHRTLASGVPAPGDRRVGVALGFTPLPGDIQELRIVTRARAGGAARLDIDAVYVYPPLAVES